MSIAQYAAATELHREVTRLRALLEDACCVFEHYDLPEHAFHYRRELEGKRSKAPNTDGNNADNANSPR